MYCSAGATGKLQYRYSTREQCCTRSSACGCGLCCLITWSRAARWQCAVLCCAAMRATGMRELQWCAVLGAGQSRSTRLRERRRRAAFVHSFGTVDAQSRQVSILQFSRVLKYMCSLCTNLPGLAANFFGPSRPSDCALILQPEVGPCLFNILHDFILN